MSRVAFTLLTCPPLKSLLAEAHLDMHALKSVLGVKR